MALTSKQRAFLKKKAHELNPLVRIGKDGITDSLIKVFQKQQTLENY